MDYHHGIRPPPNITPDDLLYFQREQSRLGLSPSASSSQASATGIAVDPSALAKLAAHFDALLAAICGRIEQLTNQTKESTLQQQYRATAVVDHAAMEMEKLQEVMRQCDELETEMLKIRRVGEMVKGFRTRIEDLERRHRG